MKKMFLSVSIVAIATTFTPGCSAGDPASDVEALTPVQVDTAAARKIVNQFYSDLSEKKYEELAAKFSGRTTSEEASKYFIRLDTSNGKMEKFEIWDITGTPADSGRANYRVMISATYENCTAHDNLVIIVSQAGHSFDGFVSVQNAY